MKKIINGKVYDTAAAKELASWSNGYSRRDFGWVRETLYLKSTGEYFLHGEGGARSQYAQQVERNTWSDGERVMPLTYHEATKWSEEHLDGDAYEAIFGRVVETDAKALTDSQLALALTEATHYSDPDAFVSDMLLSSAFIDPGDAEARPDLTLADDLRRIWTICAAPFRDFLALLGVGQSALSQAHHIPLRTVQNWASGTSECPTYTRIMMARLAGLI